MGDESRKLRKPPGESKGKAGRTSTLALVERHTQTGEGGPSSRTDLTCPTGQRVGAVHSLGLLGSPGPVPPTSVGHESLEYQRRESSPGWGRVCVSFLPLVLYEWNTLRTWAKGPDGKISF